MTSFHLKRNNVVLNLDLNSKFGIGSFWILILVPTSTISHFLVLISILMFQNSDSVDIEIRTKIKIFKLLESHPYFLSSYRVVI